MDGPSDDSRNAPRALGSADGEPASAPRPEPDPLAPDAPDASGAPDAQGVSGVAGAPVRVPRWVQLACLPLVVVAVYLVLRAAGPVLLLFVVAGLFALLLNPFVEVTKRARLPRGLAVAVVVASVIAVVVGAGFLLASTISQQVSAFQENVPGLTRDANRSLAELQEWLNRSGIDVQITREGETALQTLADRVTAGSGDLLGVTRDAVRTLVESAIALILLLVLTVYMLLYGERIGAVVRRVVPTGDGTSGDDFPSRMQAAVFGYVRAQLLFSLIMGAGASLLLYVLGSLGVFPDGRTYALVFGAFFGFAELIPYVGPAIGAFPPVLVALLGPDPLDALWLAVAFTALQQIEGHVVVPTVFGQALRINPLLVIFALLLGGRLYGFIGAFLSLPIAAILRESAVYFHRHLVFERWDLPDGLVAAGAPPSAGPPHHGATAKRSPDAQVAAAAEPDRPTSPAAAEPDRPTSPASHATGASAGERAREHEHEREHGHDASGTTQHCPECDSPVPAGAERCAVCGTELGPADAAAASTASAPG